jgi:molybdopterin converting factor subunit 1
LKLFAIARQLVGCDEVSVELADGATVGELRREVARQAPALAGVIGHAMVAVDGQYAHDRTVIPRDAEVALIPPVSGG